MDRYLKSASIHVIKIDIFYNLLEAKGGIGIEVEMGWGPWDGYNIARRNRHSWNVAQ